jgi:signal transduction histidine kinase
MMEHGEPRHNEEWIDYPDATRILVDTLKAPLKNDDGQIIGLLGVSRDITERKNYEKELRSARDEAEHLNEHLKWQTDIANKMAAQADGANRAKSEFLATMSHEIRTPMNSIVGMADLLMESELTAEQRIFTETSRNAGENLLALINDILDLSKVEADLVVMEKTDFDLDSILNRVCNLMSLKAKRNGIRIVCEPLNNIPATLIGDPQRLMQIFINLVGNAMKFTKQGEIILGVEAIHGSLDFDDRESIELRFFVRDTGIGIPPDKVELIFEMFTQADSSTTRKYGGTGLGLHISKHFVELMGGDYLGGERSRARKHFFLHRDFWNLQGGKTVC